MFIYMYNIFIVCNNDDGYLHIENNTFFIFPEIVFISSFSPFQIFQLPLQTEATIKLENTYVPQKRPEVYLSSLVACSLALANRSEFSSA